MVNSHRCSTVQFLPSVYEVGRRRFRSDSGNAVLGFVAIAPLVSLLLVALVQMAGIVWTREIAAELLRNAVAIAARRGGVATAEYNELVDSLTGLGIQVERVQWSRVSLDGEDIYEVALQVKPAGITLIPELTTTISTTAVIE